MMLQHDLLALHLMRLHQHQQAFVGALADVQRCLPQVDANTTNGQLLAEIELRSAQLAVLVKRLKQNTD